MQFHYGDPGGASSDGNVPLKMPMTKDWRQITNIFPVFLRRNLDRS